MADDVGSRSFAVSNEGDKPNRDTELGARWTQDKEV